MGSKGAGPLLAANRRWSSEGCYSGTPLPSNRKTQVDAKLWDILLESGGKQVIAKKKKNQIIMSREKKKKKTI